MVYQIVMIKTIQESIILGTNFLWIENSLDSTTNGPTIDQFMDCLYSFDIYDDRNLKKTNAFQVHTDKKKRL